MEEGEPPKTVCYYCFHGDQLKLRFDNVLSCKGAGKAGDGDRPCGFSRKNANNFTGFFYKIATVKLVICTKDYP